MNSSEYLKFRRPYERTLRQLALELDFFLEDVGGVSVYAVQHRVKSFESAIEKTRSLKIPIHDLQDIAGLRIVVATSAEVEVMQRFFSRKADSKDLTIKIDKQIDKDDGYRARHLVLEFDGHYARSVYPTQVEVQLQTIMQHAYNFISRTWVYKSGRGFPETWQEAFQALSRDLAQLDERVGTLQTQVLHLSATAGDAEPLTPFSFQRIVKDLFGEQVPLDEAVDSVRMLVDLGCDGNGQVRTFFKDPQILDLRKRLIDSDKTRGVAIGFGVEEQPLHRFFLLYGVRKEATEILLRDLGTSSQPS